MGLVLSRKIGESIVIDGDIEIIVVDVGFSTVKLNIIAPKDKVIDRKEIHNRKLKERNRE